ASLGRVIDQCLEKDPGARPASGEILADALAPALEKRVEIPVPVRVFIDRRRIAFTILPPIMVTPMAVGLIAEISQHGGPPLYKVLTAVGAVGLAFLAPIAILVF